MGIIGLIILIVFIVGIVVSAHRRWKGKDFRFSPENTSPAVTSAFTFGFAMTILLTILVAMALSGASDSRATYFINGIAFKGGTNWMIVAVAFILGFGLSGLMILFVSNLPVMLLYAVSKEGRQSKKEKLQKIEELRTSGTLPVLVRKKSIAILLAVFTCGIANWFYIKVWWIGFLQILIMFTGSICNGLGFAVFGSIMIYLMYPLWIVAIVFAVKTKEIKQKRWIITIK